MTHIDIESVPNELEIRNTIISPYMVIWSFVTNFDEQIFSFLSVDNIASSMIAVSDRDL